MKGLVENKYFIHSLLKSLIKIIETYLNKIKN